MPIDSICTGCGKTLRVGDEYAGRQARCPMCGAVYTVSNPSNSGAGIERAPLATSQLATSQLATSQLATSQQPESTLPTLAPLEDSWSSMPTSEPAANASPLPSSPLSSSPLSNSPAASVPINPLPDSAAQIVSPNDGSQYPSSTPRFYVRTPNGSVYGPCDTKTVNDWIQQGRLDETCHIRSESTEQWIGIPAWQFQLKRAANPVVGLGGSTSTVNQFGDAPLSATQSAGYARSGNGVWVLILGILSWVLCMTVIGAPICAVIAIFLGMTELSNIKIGKSPESDRPLVLIGLCLAVLNLVCSIGMIAIIVIVSILNP